MKAICEGCIYNKGSWCNRLVHPGFFGRHDRVASDYLTGDHCDYREAGESTIDNNKPNFENS